MEVSKLLKCIVVRKGPIDLITDGSEAIFVRQPGSLKRCGGIGDILSGVIGTFSQYQIREEMPFEIKNKKLDSLALACYVTRMSSNLAFKKRKHSLTAPDIIEELAEVIAGAV